MGECIRIGDDVRIFVIGISGNRVRIGIQAPDSLDIVRLEVESPDEAAAIVEEFRRGR